MCIGVRRPRETPAGTAAPRLRKTWGRQRCSAAHPPHLTPAGGPARPGLHGQPDNHAGSSGVEEGKQKRARRQPQELPVWGYGPSSPPGHAGRERDGPCLRSPRTCPGGRARSGGRPPRRAAGSAPPAHGAGWVRARRAPAPRPGWGWVGFSRQGTPHTTATALPILLGSGTWHVTSGGLHFVNDIGHYAVLPADGPHSENVFLYGHWSPNPPCSDYSVSFQTGFFKL